MERVDYLVVGGGLAGGYAVQTLRQKAPSARILLVTDEPNLPYDRVPLSKGYLTGKVKRESLFLKKKEFYEEQKIEIVTGHRIDRIDVQTRTAFLDDGRELEFSKLLLATGGRVRRLPLPGEDLQGIYYLRTIEDSEVLQRIAAQNHRVVVVGGGFIGCELAAALSSKGLDTTILEVTPYLLSLVLDSETARWVTEQFIGHGVKVVTDAAAAQFVGENGRVVAVETKDGRRIPADFVAVGVGITPNTELAEKAGLRTEKGIVVDEHLETSVMGVYAAGDVARFYNPLYGRSMRVEHYDVAVKQGRIAAANMAGEQQVFAEPPHFFSFMYDMVCKVYGDLSQHDQVIRRGELDLKKGFLQFYLQAGCIIAVLSMNGNPEELKAARRLINPKRKLDDPLILSDTSKSLESLLPPPSEQSVGRA